MSRLRKQLFLVVSLAALMLLGPIPFLLAQTTVITAGGGVATSVSAAAFPLRAPDGTAAAPSYSFSSATGDGFFWNTANSEVTWVENGVTVAGVNTSGGSTFLTLRNSAQLSFHNAGTGNPSAGFEWAANNVVGTTNGTTGEGWVQNSAGDQFLTADHTNATATPTNLTDLTTNVTTGRKYVCDLNLMVSQSVAADGARVDFEGGTATATNFRANVTILDGLAYDTHTSVTALATDVTSTDIGTTVKIEAKGLSFEPSSTGTFIPRIGLEAASTGTITTFRGSSLLCKDTP